MAVLLYLCSAPVSAFEFFSVFDRVILFIPLAWAAIGVLLALTDRRLLRWIFAAVLLSHYATIPLGPWLTRWPDWSYVFQRLLGGMSGVLPTFLGSVALYLGGQVLIWWVFVGLKRRANERRSPSRRWQFTLRGLLLLPLVLSLALASIVPESRRAQRQSRATARLQEAGAAVDRVLREDRWIAILGQGFLNDALEISCRNSNVCDDDLVHLKEFPLLYDLDLSGTAVSDTGLRYLAGLEYLGSLWLRDTSITDAGLLQLTKLEALGLLDLGNTQITDEGLSALRGLPLLGFLRLDGTKITDAGLAEISERGRLRSLDLSGTRITDEGLRHLVRCSRLFSLDLSDTDITDTGLRHLTGMKELMYLDLATVNVTDSGLHHLKHMKCLTDLVLSGTPVTGTGLCHLTNLDDLSRLDLSNTLVNDAGLAELDALLHRVEDCRFQYLYLDLSGTRITDDGLRHLAGSKRLSILRLADTQITDAGLAHLRDLPELSYIDLEGTQITDNAVPLLKELGVMQLNLKNTRVSDVAKASLTQQGFETDVD